MKINIIAAVARNRVIGCSGKIPWHYPEDMAYFRKLTINHVIIMGRRTYEEIGAPLPGRITVILSKSKKFSGQNIETAPDLKQALEIGTALAQQAGFPSEIFLCGGQEIYQQGIRIANRIYLTEIHVDYPGDRFFPEFTPEQFRLIRRTPGQTAGLTFCVYEKNIF
ncbi:MAG: dihydrofolate reductase [Oscillospiraceae bacterium]|nr:dihydrofolate reductase [Oscillospiraceae bacterium]